MTMKNNTAQIFINLEKDVILLMKDAINTKKANVLLSIEQMLNASLEEIKQI